ncbi:hypothetical protein [Nonomuraea sp. NPDC049158]|uniref:hypothetical protein n=1 Tax=Nonomuraea sp. NPDC049158 TaxID=3155649 RepID=UPI0033FC8E8A
MAFIMFVGIAVTLHNKWDIVPEQCSKYIRGTAPVVNSGGRHMRADARKNHDQLLAVARTVVAEQGADASLRRAAASC